MLALCSWYFIYWKAASHVCKNVIFHFLLTLCSHYIISLFLVLCSFSSMPDQSLMAISHYCLKTHLYKTDVSQRESNGCIASCLVLQADRHLQNCGNITHIGTWPVDIDTFAWDHRNTRDEMRKQLYLFSADPATAKGTPTHIPYGLQVELSFRDFLMEPPPLFDLFISIIKEIEMYPKRQGRWIVGLTGN